MSMEWARSDHHRGFIAAWPQFGVPAGLFLANLAALAFSAIAGDQFLVWGWRIPFLLSIVMIAVGLYIRLGIVRPFTGRPTGRHVPQPDLGSTPIAKQHNVIRYWLLAVFSARGRRAWILLNIRTMTASGLPSS